jgi:hypothetical protein
MQGLEKFMGKIGVYLQKGLMDWLFGALGSTGLQLPEKFDLEGIISIVLQILGLTYARFRARAVAIVGEPVVAALEQAAEVFKIVTTEGIPGLWRFIKEQLANLKSMVLDAIFDFIKERVIMAGITWIIGLLNPASAFFKACKAIYDIVMFFINRGSQILELVNAVVDSIASIAKGAISTAAGLVEGALAKAIPVAIGFLASLLGLGDPAAPVRATIEKARSPVDMAMVWVINMAVKGVKAAWKFIGGLFGGKKKEGSKEDESTNDLGDIYAQASNELATRLPGEVNLAQVKDASAEVLQVLKPLGLKNLFVDERGEEDFALMAEASPGKEVAGLVPEDKNVTVTLTATLKLSGEMPALASVERTTGFFKPQKEAEKITGGRRVAYLSPADTPSGLTSRDVRATRESGGVLIEPASAAKELEIIAWNTGAPIKGTNVSHAERQLHDWLKHEDRLRPRVMSIALRLNRSPCGRCTDYLVNLLEMIPQAKGNSSLEWTELHRGKVATTPDDIAKLKGAKWELSPSNPLPPGTATEDKPPVPVKVIIRRRG